ncbi:MAG: serine--tRNA ligase [Desulfarculaceae bacterium]|nr:serine--tRNA ligase [Desulfarculaceae bacterium]MCF8073102.1 serine--tRNA ligase [Desulfarculaceae bacterium]MCF8101813.1 serine--tRNA ligase [Desulfarculaceae bacterium]MCF8115340.1 serine--tRNA ligase [Desulfarculaceae bacterium]
MLDLKFLRENLELVKKAVAERQAVVDLAGFESLDAQRRAILPELEGLRARRNEVSQEVGRVKREGGDPSGVYAEMKEVGGRIKELEGRLAGVEEEVKSLLYTIPNPPHESVPVGKGEEDNPVVETWGEPPKFDFEPLNHWDIGEALDILDFEAAARMTGARFAVLKSAGARLERALTSFMLDLHTGEHGYLEVLPPFMVNSQAMTGTGQLPKFAEDLFKLENTDYWLIPTAEVPVTNLHMGEVIEAERLPLKYTAYTPCFRAEAGSHGKDVRGLVRLHQFDKVELVRLVRPEESYQHLEELTANAEKVLQLLGLPYQKVVLCTADLGFSAAKTYDLEVWLPGQNRYREISSCSNFEDFQARRAGLRFKEKGAKGTTLLHTLNGSGLAVGRTMVAILENYQQADGTVKVPPALVPYMGGLELITPRES